ncbi:unnamed protein product [Rotaria sp. Silwood1]|nr:unnamed protein product [Rotaria sp. Silwood1]
MLASNLGFSPISDWPKRIVDAYIGLVQYRIDAIWFTKISITLEIDVGFELLFEIMITQCQFVYHNRCWTDLS